MKKLLKNSLFRVMILIFGNISLFVFLVYYIIPYTVTTTVTAFLTVILFLLFMLIFTVTMICEMCFDEASKHLVAYADLDKAYYWMQIMKRIDILGWYQPQYSVFMTLFYRDKDRIADLKKVLENKCFSKNESMQLVYHYNQMIIAIYENNCESADKYYQLLSIAYSIDSKKKKTALIYSLAMVDAEKNLYDKQWQQAKKSLAKVPVSKLNQREQAYYFYLKYLQSYYSGNKKRAIAYLEIAHKKYPQAELFKEID